MLTEQEFQKKADAAFDDLRRGLLSLGDEYDFDVEGESGKLEVIFEATRACQICDLAKHAHSRNLDFRAIH